MLHNSSLLAASSEQTIGNKLVINTKLEINWHMGHFSSSVKTFQADTKSEWISSGIDNLRETTRESIQTKFPDYKEFGPNFIRNLLLQDMLITETSLPVEGGNRQESMLTMFWMIVTDMLYIECNTWLLQLTFLRTSPAKTIPSDSLVEHLTTSEKDPYSTPGGGEYSYYCADCPVDPLRNFRYVQIHSENQQYLPYRLIEYLYKVLNFL
uniref:Uncharacterized protein n=1 Tax=Daphnia galeata TaxID=27404 RepID=A0A8J2RFI8_9CRUS|nr:unnamed protein product [Daphnia galeata]